MILILINSIKRLYIVYIIILKITLNPPSLVILGVNLSILLFLNLATILLSGIIEIRFLVGLICQARSSSWIICSVWKILKFILLIYLSNGLKLVDVGLVEPSLGLQYSLLLSRNISILRLYKLLGNLNIVLRCVGRVFDMGCLMLGSLLCDCPVA